MIEEPKQLTINNNRRRPTQAQIAAFQGIQSSFVVDAMYGKGALNYEIAPIGNGRDINCIAAGPALTADCGPSDILPTLAALKFIEEGDILVSAFADHRGCAAAGDRATGFMKNCGAAGFVTDGPLRDYKGVVSVGLPVWCTGLTPSSPFAKGPGSVGFPIQIGGQQVATGDMIIADCDGVVVVPYERIDEVIKAVAHVKEIEESLDQEIVDGLKIPPEILEILEGDDIKYVS